MLEKLKELYANYKKPILFIGGAIVAFQLWKRFKGSKSKY